MAPVDAEGRRYCWKCRSYYPSDEKICAKCGTNLETGEGPQEDAAKSQELPTDGLPRPVRATPARMAVLVVAAGYVFLALWLAWATGDVCPEIAGAMAFSVLSLILIWFPEAMGSYGHFRGAGIHKMAVPPRLVSLLGWFLLVGFPALMFLVRALR